MTHTPDSDELAGLLAALPNLHGDAQRMAVDAILYNLESTAPQVARIVGAVVSALDEPARKAIEERFTGYDGNLPLADAKTSLVDCLILTIKEVEWRAALAAFDVPMASFTHVDDQTVHFFERDGLRYAIAPVGVDGNTESAIMFGRYYEALHPRAAVLVGMAGGVLGKVKPGDVVVAKHVHAYDFRKLTEDGTLPRTKTYNVPDRVARKAESMLVFERSWFRDVVENLRNVLSTDAYASKGSVVPKEGWEPQVTAGDVLAGGSLIEDGSLPDWAKHMNEKIKAAEMEGAGFAAAADELSIPWMVVRGIADNGKEGRKDNWQFGSTYVAASWLRAAIRLKMVDLKLGTPTDQDGLT
jgi:nucleoside phosphorylase